MGLAGLAFVLGFAVSLLSGLLGIGGGIVLAPALLYLPPLLGLGHMDMKTVSGLTITQGLFACLSGTMRHDRHHAVNHRLVAWMGATFFASALSGALISHWVASEVLMLVFAAMALLAAVLMWLPVHDLARDDAPAGDFDLRIAVGIALVVGLLGGLVGQGGSFILIPLLLHGLKLPTRIAIGSNLALVAIASLAGFAGKLATGQVQFLPALAIVAGAIPAAQIGSALSFRTPPRWLRYLLAALILLVALKMTSDVLVPRLQPCRSWPMQIGIVIVTNDPETVWNAFRYGVFARKQGDHVKVFLLGKGVECESLVDEKFNVGEQLRDFVEAGGEALACGICLKARQSEGSDLCPISTLKDLHGVIRESERLLTF